MVEIIVEIVLLHVPKFEFHVFNGVEKTERACLLEHTKIGLTLFLNQMKEIKVGLKGYKYLDEAIELCNELGLAITDAEIVRTNSTGLTIYNPKNLSR